MTVFAYVIILVAVTARHTGVFGISVLGAGGGRCLCLEVGSGLGILAVFPYFEFECLRHKSKRIVADKIDDNILAVQSIVIFAS